MATGSLGSRQPYSSVIEPPSVERNSDESRQQRRGLFTWFNDLPAQLKGLIALILVFATMGAQSAFAYRTSLASERSAALVVHTEEIIVTANEVLGNLIDMETGLRGFYLTGKDDFLAPYNNGRVAFQANIRQLKLLTADNALQVRRWEDIEARAAIWQRDVADPGLALRREVTAGRAPLDDIVRFVGSGQEKLQTDAMRTAVAEAVSVEQALLAQRVQTNNAAGLHLRQVIIWGSVGTLVFGLILVVAISQSGANATKELVQAVIAVSEGRQDQRVNYRAKDELGQLADAFRTMMAYQKRMAVAADAIAHGDLSVEVRPQSQHDVLGNAFARMNENLRSLVGELQAGTHNLSSAGTEILAASAQQAAGAIEQSAAIAETTATVDQVRSSAEQTVIMAQIVTETAAQANRVADDGVAAVHDATAVMADIRERVQSIAENILVLSEQSQQIGEIITTVNDIADQSNLLALNAAIEASRAGEHGKGFTVVAQEIRTLAEGSKAATAQVRTILSDIQRSTNAAVMATEQGTKGVDVGMRTIGQTGRMIDDLADAIRQAAGSASQITASVRQHAVGMEQIAVAMADINGATSQNLAAVTNTRQAAENLTDLAGRLDGLIRQYQM